jgi:hypothetical protein
MCSNFFQELYSELPVFLQKKIVAVLLCLSRNTLPKDFVAPQILSFLTNSYTKEELVASYKFICVIS